MAVLNFPSNPNLNQVYQANESSWRWDGDRWKRLPDPGAVGAQGLTGVGGTWASSTAGIWTGRNVGIGSELPLHSLDVGGDTKLDGNLDVTGITTLRGNIVNLTGSQLNIGANVISDVNPYVDNGYRLGGSNRRWGELHVRNVNAGIITAVAFVGDGSGLTGLGGTEFVHAQTLQVNGISTFSGSVIDTHGQVGAAKSVLTSTGAGVSWGSAAAKVNISATAPTTAEEGDLWWDSDDGDLGVYYNDGSSAQWVTVSEGPIGPAGAQGVQGTAGAVGAQGAQGAQGHQGVQGAQGHQGVQGSVGAQGHQGRQGATGAQGHQGVQGAQGAQGATGTGAQGHQGVQGTGGSGGSAGAQGHQGVQGAVGAQGHQGRQGAQGVQGATGAGGAGGAQGAQGVQGAQGAQGVQGAQGATGTTGNDGSATISNNADNRVITGGSGTNLNGEANLTFDGTNLDLGDNKKIRIGASQDIEIYHESSSNKSVIKNKHEGAFFTLQSGAGNSGGFTFKNEDDDETYLLLKRLGVEIFYNDNKKFETTTDGVKITGGLQDKDGNLGSSGQVLSSTGSQVDWVSSDIPAGTKMMFIQSSAPTGWTKDTNNNNRALRIVNGTSGGNQGGSNEFTNVLNSSVNTSGGDVSGHTLTSSQMPQHRHNVDTYNEWSTTYGHYTQVNGSWRQVHGGGTRYPPYTSNTGSSNSHDHGFTNPSFNLNVRYVDAIICSKD